MARTYYLSFCDDERPTGDQFLGGCVVRVEDADAELMAIEVALRFPNAAEDAEWIAAACRKAHELGINPGGQVLSLDITDAPMPEGFPIGVLMSRAEMERFGPVDSVADLQAEDA